MKKLVFLVALTICTQTVFAQTKKQLKEADRQYLVKNLKRSLDSLTAVTKGLSKAQWNFKETPKSWSIAEVVEHLAIYEVLFDREIGTALFYGPQPELAAKDARTDSAYLGFLAEEKVHETTEYTKPFTYTVPMGLTEGKNSLAWLAKSRNEAVHYVDTTKADLRVYYINSKGRSVYQRFLVMFGHVDRHLRQIARIKKDPRYPRK